ncbi:MAG: lamin tail domain-containing protein, partial [bacterium]
TDLHLAGTSLGDFDLAGTPIAAVTADFDGDSRDATYPYMGADEGSVVLTPPAAAPDVFFSEYIEGSSNNKAVEIYNGSGESVDLANFAVWRISNDGDWAEGETNAFALSGTLADGDVYVIGNAGAVAAILDVSDVTGTTTYFNGDDPIALVYNGIIIDVVGAPYVVDSADDPIVGWDVAGVTDATAEHTMVRKTSVTTGNTDWAASAGTNADDSEWEVYPQNTFEFLGEHPSMPRVFFSEYIEGSSNNKAVEIYNGSGESVDLANFAVWRISNDGDWTEGETNAFALSGTLTNGDVYVIGNASAVAAILDVSDVTGTTTYFNGDDPIALVYNGIIIDVVGAPYVVDSADDPIAGWDVAGVTDATAEHTMVRKASVTKGNTDWAASAGTNVDDSEWIVYPVDTFDYLGEHPTIVNPDSDPPLISKIKAMNQTTVVVTFNEDVDPATAGTVANYSIDNSIGAATAAVVVDSVVTLTVATLTYDLQYVLTVNTVEDIAGNVIVANSTINFTLVTPTAPVGLFFSEYIEGGGDNKALEIYNGTDADVDLSNIQIFTNYNGNPYNDAHTFPEGAVLAAGDVWVIANSAAVQPILDAADELFLYNESGYIVGYNGDDVRALVHIHGADTTVLDIIGLYNFLDPGDGWDVAGVVSGTKDHTLVRKASVTSGNTDWATSAGTNADNSEWEAYGKDIVGYLGEHPTVIGAITTIAEIQDTTGTTNGDSKFKDQVVTTTGIVTAAKTGAYFIQDKTGPWNGVYVYDSGRTPTVGDSIVIKCKVAEYYNLTELANVEQYITMKVGLELPDPALLTTASYQEEQWEGVLVVVDSATCTNDATEWKIDDGSGEGIVDDVFIAYEATQGNMYTITGPVYYSFNLFRIVPANADFIIDLTPVPLTPFDWEIAAGDLSFFANDHLTRGMSFNPITNHVLVPSRTGGTNVFILDAATGDSLGKLDMTGVTGGTYTMNIVDVAEDGAIYLGNLALAAGNFKLYQWANETAVPTNIFDGVVSERTGDVIEVAGAGVNTVIYASGSASTSIFTWTTTDGAAFTLTDTISVAAGLARGGIAAIGDGGFWVNGSGTNTTHIDASGAVLNAADAGIIATGWQNVDYLHHSGGRKLIAVVGKNAADFGDQVQIYDITESEVSPVLFDSARFTSIYNANTNAAGDVHMIDNMDGTVTAYVMITNNGIGRYTFDVPDEVKELTIAGARIDADGDFYPDLNGKVVKVKGIITSPDYNLKYVPPVRDYPSISYYIQDETGGINLYTDKFKKYLKLGDEIEVTGEIASYLGVVEIIVADSNDLVLLSSDNALPEPLKLKIADIGESTEGLLVELDSVWFVDPSTWPAPGAYTNMDLTDGIDTIMFRVDDDTQLDEWGNPPQEMFRVICIASQYSYSTPPNDTYQLLGIDSTFFYPIIKEIVPVTVLDESFEDVFPPEDWRVFSKNVTAGTPTEPWNKSNNAPQSGTYNAHMGNYNTQSDCWLVTPPIDLLGEEMLDLLKFYARDDLNTSANDFGSELKIYASTLSNNDIADFVLVSTITEADCYGATPEFTINLKQFVDADYVFIGFMVHNFGDPLNPNAGGDNWNIDNVQLVADLGIKETIPVAFALNQNYPNPFNPTTNIKLALPEQADVKLTVYNIIGQEVAIIQAGKMQAGYHNFVFDASRLSSGVYFYRVEANNFHALKKMTILK